MNDQELVATVKLFEDYLVMQSNLDISIAARNTSTDSSLLQIIRTN